MGLNLSPLKTSFLAAVQVLAFKWVKMTKITFHIFVNFPKTFSSWTLVLIKIVEDSKIDEPAISQTLASI